MVTLQDILYKINNSFILNKKDLEDQGVRFSAPLRETSDLLMPRTPIGNLGDPEFCHYHGVRYPYMMGAMANGISSCQMVAEAAQEGMLGIFGAGGLSLDRVQGAIEKLQGLVGGKTYGFNLIHSPNEPDLEDKIVDLYIKYNIDLIEASAFLRLTLPLVRYRLHGIYRGPDGRVIVPNRVIAKVSRVEVARQFLAPPPDKFLKILVDRGAITHEEAKLATEIPMAEDITAEADSGGHTDGRPAIALIPTLLSLRDAMVSTHRYDRPLRVGAAGGIGTPLSAAAAFAMGAAYIVTGSINQACVESGTSGAVRELLGNVKQADVALAPSADMFELGAKVQVVKRGTMFAMRAARLYNIYTSCASIEDIPETEREVLEGTIFQSPLDIVWENTIKFFEERDYSQITKAKNSTKYKMALIFRSYLGQASHWAIQGALERKMDFQVWCGAAMGAFNEWAKGSPLEKPQNRKVANLGYNLLWGAAIHTRLNILRSQGVLIPINIASQIGPLDDAAIDRLKAEGIFGALP